ncbi:MAG: DUF2240 family protein [Halobacteriaceae archaeon]
MTLRTIVAAPFVWRGKDRLRTNEFVVAISLDRDWVTPDQAKRLIDLGIREELLIQDGDELEATFDVNSISIPDTYELDEDIFRDRSTFEQVLDKLTDQEREKQAIVANINELQSNLDLNADAAAVLYARREGLDVAQIAKKAMEREYD